MEWGSALALAVLIVVIASFPAVLWFFKIRRSMIRRISQVARELEEALGPRDARYWYLGYLVGFRARYWVNRGPVSTVSALYTIPPYHVFFYLPVIILGKRRETLDIAVKLRLQPLLKGEAHLVDESDRYARLTFRKDVGDPSRLKARASRLSNGRLTLYHRGDERLAHLATSLARSLEEAGAEVVRVSIIPSERIVYAALHPPRGGPIAPLARAVLNAAERAAKGSTGAAG